MQAHQHSAKEIHNDTHDQQHAGPAAGNASRSRRKQPGICTSAGTSGVFAGLLMVTGTAWNAGLKAVPFRPAIVGIVALAIHVAPLVAIMACLVPTLRSARADSSRGRGMTVAAGLAIAFGIFSATFSVTHPHAVMGVHNMNDVLPIAILDAGAVLWLVRGRPADARKAQRRSRGTSLDGTAGAGA